jgi:hypothetical protein
MAEYADKLRSLGFLRRKGSSNTTPVVRDVDGQVGGTRTEHWDDRVDATVTRMDVTVNPALKARASGEAD